MAVTVTEEKVIQIGQSEALVTGTFAWSGSYATGGDDIGTQTPGSTDYEVFQGSLPGWAITYDRANKKLQAWGSNGAAPAALAEHAAAAFVQTGGTFIATRPT
jgi:hypothetical protein